MGDISAHFSRSEFRDHRTGQLVGPSPALITILEAIRTRIGRPLPIVSGYRSQATNRAVGGARSSFHLTGRAADLPEGLVTVDIATVAGAGGLGVCRGWVVHVDDRPRINGRPVIFEDC